jgi:hypothetical protein
MSSPREGSTVERDVTVMLTDVRAQITEMRGDLSDLELSYRLAGGDLKNLATRDAEDIERLRDEAQRLVVLLRGGALFGRYAADADRHRRTANLWRWGAVAVLLTATALLVGLPLLISDISWAQTFASVAPLVLLFTYASSESSNHRQRELDRRRIYLRMAAIESYIDGRRDEAKALLDLFIRKHFIEPDLDANELTVVGARGAGMWGSMIRYRHRWRASSPRAADEDGADADEST